MGVHSLTEHIKAATATNSATDLSVQRSGMLPRLNAISTVIAGSIVIGAGVVGLLVLPVGMTMATVVMMILPSMVVFGLIMLLIGVAHGLYRAER